MMDDDTDLDLDECDLEDSFVLSDIALGAARGLGCSIADPGGASAYEDDEGNNPAAGNLEDELQKCDSDSGPVPHYGTHQTNCLPDMMVLQSDLANTRAHSRLTTARNVRSNGSSTSSAVVSVCESRTLS